VLDHCDVCQHPRPRRGNQGGSAGLQEAVNYAYAQGGGQAQIDAVFNKAANAIVA